MAWVVVMTAALFFFYVFIQMNMFNAIDDHLMKAFALDATGLGKLSGYFFWSNVLFLLVAGLILDRFSARWVILITMVSTVVGTGLFATTHSVPAAGAYRFLAGIGSGFCFLGSVRLASRWFPGERMALVTGMIFTVAFLGGMVAQTPLTLLVNAVGWREALLMDTGLGVVLMLLILIIVRDYPPNYAAADKAQHRDLQQLGYWASWRLAFLRLRNWLGGLYASLLNLPFAVLGGTWGIPYLVTVHKLTIAQASYVTSMLFLGTIIGSPLMGWFSDRLRRRKLPMIIGVLASLIVVLFILYTPDLSLTGLMLLFLLLGFVTSTQVISYPMVAESNPKMLTATSVSVVSISVIGGFALFQPIFGWLMDLSGHGVVQNGSTFYGPQAYVWPMLMIPIGFALSFLISLFVHETRCKPQES